MTEQKQQYVADLMDSDVISDADVEQLINDSEMQSKWSRYHLVSNIMQGEVAEVCDSGFTERMHSAILNEPTILVPQNKTNQDVVNQSAIVTNIGSWIQQATGFAIAASVTAVIVFGVQKINTPDTPQVPVSAITSLKFLEVDNLQLAEQPDYSRRQESLLDYTRRSSQYGLQTLTPFVSVVNHSVTVPLTLIKSNYQSLLDDKAIKEAKEDNKDNASKH